MDSIVFYLPMNLQPLARGELFDFPLCDIFDETECGDYVGGGTFGDLNNVSGVQVEIELRDLKFLPRILGVFISGGAPDSSMISFGESFNKKDATLLDLKREYSLCD